MQPIYSFPPITYCRISGDNEVCKMTLKTVYTAERGYMNNYQHHSANQKGQIDEMFRSLKRTKGDN